MQLPRWTTTENDTFWRRHYEVATVPEQACEKVMEQQVQKWLREVELMDGPATPEDDAEN